MPSPTFHHSCMGVLCSQELCRLPRPPHRMPAQLNITPPRQAPAQRPAPDRPGSSGTSMPGSTPTPLLRSPPVQDRAAASGAGRGGRGTQRPAALQPGCAQPRGVFAQARGRRGALARRRGRRQPRQLLARGRGVLPGPVRHDIQAHPSRAAGPWTSTGRATEQNVCAVCTGSWYTPGPSRARRAPAMPPELPPTRANAPRRARHVPRAARRQARLHLAALSCLCRSSARARCPSASARAASASPRAAPAASRAAASRCLRQRARPAGPLACQPGLCRRRRKRSLGAQDLPRRCGPLRSPAAAGPRLPLGPARARRPARRAARGRRERGSAGAHRAAAASTLRRACASAPRRSSAA